MKIIQAQPVKNKKINCWKYCVLSVEQCLFCVLHTVSTFEIDNKVRRYSLISPCGHLYNTDTSLLRTVRLVLEMPEIIHSLPLSNGHLCKLDTLLCPFGVRIKEFDFMLKSSMTQKYWPNWLLAIWWQLLTSFTLNALLHTKLERDRRLAVKSLVIHHLFA